MKSSTVLAVSAALALAAGLARAEAGDTEAGPAEARLRELDQAYVAAWKEDGTERQAAALLPLFAEDAVILPGGGLGPKRGSSGLREFWFPEGSPPTRVRSFEHVVHGVEVQDGLGVVYGRAKLEFEYDGNEVAQEGNFLFAARRQAGGDWKITQMIWNNRRLP